MSKLLEIDDLHVNFHTESGVVRALRGVNLAVERGERVGLVGETGSGKSVTARSVMRLIESPPGKIESGTISFEGQDILSLSKDELRKLRGRRIAMIFQDPSSSLDPVYTIRNQMIEVITTNRDVTKPEAEEIAIDMLEEVDMPRPEGVLENYPHELSGGMKQRVVIAMELACEPDLLIADEPTTALDVTVQKKVLSIFQSIIEDRDLSVLWITHNLGVVAQFCNRVAVMYAGEVAEYGNVYQLFDNPTHPYTRELLETIPNMANPEEELNVIEGSVPGMQNPPSGCAFHPRCPDAIEECEQIHPDRVQGRDYHEAACLVHDVEGDQQVDEGEQ